MQGINLVVAFSRVLSFDFFIPLIEFSLWGCHYLLLVICYVHLTPSLKIHVRLAPALLVWSEVPTVFWSLVSDDRTKVRTCPLRIFQGTALAGRTLNSNQKDSKTSAKHVHKLNETPHQRRYTGGMNRRKARICPPS